MITRRKRPLHPLRQLQRDKYTPEFKPKQTFPQLDLLTDFQFEQKKQIILKEIDFGVVFKDLYPYYRFYSITTCLIMLVMMEFLWQQVQGSNFNNNNSSNPQKYFDHQDNWLVSLFWQRLSQLITYANFLLIIVSYLESTYKLWFIMCYILSYIIGLLVFLFKQGSIECFTTKEHIWTSTYAVYLLILVQKKMKYSSANNNSFNEIWIRVKKLSIWSRLSEYLSNKKKNTNEQSQLIDFGFTQRPLSIKGGQTDDSFSYDSFFTYNSDPMDFLQQEKLGTPRGGYFQSNISKRSSFISSFSAGKQTFTNKIAAKKSSTNDNNTNTIQTNKPFLSASEIQSTIASSQLAKNQKIQEEQQMIKIYKSIIFSYLIYMNVTRVEWIAYLVAVCGVLAWVEILTNQKLRLVKFGCLAVVGIGVMAWF